jgi:hypothetical protein
VADAGSGRDLLVVHADAGDLLAAALRGPAGEAVGGTAKDVAGEAAGPEAPWEAATQLLMWGDSVVRELLGIRGGCPLRPRGTSGERAAERAEVPLAATLAACELLVSGTRPSLACSPA